MTIAFKVTNGYCFDTSVVFKFLDLTEDAGPIAEHRVDTVAGDVPGK
jgi:hypothetical protein